MPQKLPPQSVFFYKCKFKIDVFQLGQFIISNPNCAIWVNGNTVTDTSIFFFFFYTFCLFLSQKQISHIASFIQWEQHNLTLTFVLTALFRIIIIDAIFNSMVGYNGVNSMSAGTLRRKWSSSVKADLTSWDSEVTGKAGRYQWYIWACVHMFKSFRLNWVQHHKQKHKKEMKPKKPNTRSHL